MASEVQKSLIAEGEADVLQGYPHKWSKITIKSGIASESLVLVVYGVVIAVLGFLSEIAAKPLRRLTPALGITITYLYVAFRRVIAKFEWNSLRAQWQNAGNQISANLLSSLGELKRNVAASFFILHRKFRNLR